MSATKIKADISELKSINNNIQQLSEQLRPLRQRKKQLEESILQYMRSANQDQPINTIKMQDIQIVAVEKKVREKLSKDEKEDTAVKLLQQSGVANARKTFAELQEMMKGEEKTEKKIKVLSQAQAMNLNMKKQKGSLK